MSAVWIILVACAAFVAYPYLVYPAVLALAGRLRRRGSDAGPPAEWPHLTITVPVYNEVGHLIAELDRIQAGLAGIDVDTIEVGRFDQGKMSSFCG